MVIYIACKYNGNNLSAHEELIGLGYETILEFADKKLTTDATEVKTGKILLTLDLLEDKTFMFKIFALLKNKLRNYTLRMSSYSETFSDLYSDKREKVYSASSYGSMAPDDEPDCANGEYCPVEFCDERCEEDRDVCELMIDIERTLEPEDYILLNKRLNGEKLTDLAEQYGVSFQAINKRLDKIRKKLMPLAESLRG